MAGLWHNKLEEEEEENFANPSIAHRSKQSCDFHISFKIYCIAMILNFLHHVLVYCVYDLFDFVQLSFIGTSHTSEHTNLNHLYIDDNDYMNCINTNSYPV